MARGTSSISVCPLNSLCRVPIYQVISKQKPATRCIGSGASRKALQCRPMSDAALGNCLELQSDPQFGSAGPVCAKDQAADQDQFLPAPGLGTGQLGSRSASACSAR